VLALCLSLFVSRSFSLSLNFRFSRHGSFICHNFSFLLSLSLPQSFFFPLNIYLSLSPPRPLSFFFPLYLFQFFSQSFILSTASNVRSLFVLPCILSMPKVKWGVSMTILANKLKILENILVHKCNNEIMKCPFRFVL